MSELPLPPSFRPLGHTGIAVSPLAWGMWRLAEDGRCAADAAKLVHAALDAGITFLDTADIYGFDGNGGFGNLGGFFVANQRVQRGHQHQRPVHQRGLACSWKCMNTHHFNSSLNFLIDNQKCMSENPYLM